MEPFGFIQYHLFVLSGLNISYKRQTSRP